MKFETMQKLYKAKRKLSKATSNTWYTLVYPLAWLLDKHSEVKYKYFQKKVDNLTIQKVGELMAKEIQKRLVVRPKTEYEFYVCKSDCKGFWDDDCIDTPLAHLLTKDLFINDCVYEWARRSADMNDVWLSNEMCQIIYDELCDVQELDVCWHHTCELNEKYKYFDLVKDYQKHLVIKVKK